MSVVIAFQKTEHYHSSPNVTLVSWNNNRSPEVLLTFPFLEHPVTGAHQEDITHGVRIINEDAFIQFKKYFNRSSGLLMTAMHHQSMAEVIESARKALWSSDPREYLRSIAISISDSLWSDNILNETIVYTGLIGSILNHNPSTAPRDIDVIIIFKKPPTPDEYSQIQQNVKEVCERYTSKEISFLPVWESCPIKIPDKSAGNSFPVHILINTIETVSKWSTFISSHRRTHKEDLRGICPTMAEKFKSRSLLDETHGIKSLLNQIKEKRVHSMMWSKNGAEIEQIRSYLPLEDSTHIVEFLAYAIRWTTYNLHHASDTNFPPEALSQEIEAVRALGSKFSIDSEQIEVLIKIVNSEYLRHDSNEAIEVTCAFLEKAKHYCNNIN